MTAFLPVGHIALQAFPERNVRFSLPATTCWVKSLYISWYTITRPPPLPLGAVD